MRTELQNGYILKLPKKASDYEITKLLGRGASCFVYLARYIEDEIPHEVILKEYNPRSLALERDETGALCIPTEYQEQFTAGMIRFERGYKRQSAMRLNSNVTNSTTNIQEIHFANNTRYIEMTLSVGTTYQIDNGATDSNLYDFLRRMRSLATVIGYYHDAGYLHLDIKPDNIFAPKSNDGKDVILFDFDSVVEQSAVVNSTTQLSYTKDWAAMEQLNPANRKTICKATDIFSVGEMIFYRIFGRHSNLSERRSYSTYTFDYEADIFKNVNPKAFPLLNELLKKTLCNVVKNRYQTTGDLIAKLDELIKLTDPKEPYLISSSIMAKDYFIGRENELEKIHSHFQDNNILFLSGIGGIGKSELARNYAKRYKAMGDYDTILFSTYGGSWMMLVNDDKSVHIANFERFPEEQEPDYYRRKMRKLKELADERTLFVIDNLNEAEFEPDAQKQWKDILDLGCKMLITTRLREWAYPLLVIDVFSERNGLVKLFSNYCIIKNDAELEAVNEIIDYVDGHTLTMELIAKQIKAGFSNPVKMLSKLREYGIAQSGKEKVVSMKDNEQSRASAFDHISALFDIANLNEQEKYVLANMSLMPPSGIQAELFAEWCELEDFDAVNSLINGGWLNCTDDMIKMHPVVSESATIKLSFAQNLCSHLLISAKEWVSNRNLKGLDSIELKYRADLVYFIATRLIFLDLETEEIASFLNKVPTIFWKYGKLKFAILCREKALQIRLRLLGEDDADTAKSYFNLGRMYKEAGDFESAKENYDKALAIRQSLFGEEHEDTASSYNALGVLYKELKQFDIAEKYELKALHIRKRLLGENNEDVATSYNCLAVLYRELERYDESEQCHFCALEIRKHLFGVAHEDVATSYNNIGVLYSDLGDLDKSEVYLLKALESRIMIFGEMHLSTAVSYSNLGSLYRKRGEFGSAKNNYQKALEIRSALLGETHSKTVSLKKRISKLPDGSTRFSARQDVIRNKIHKIFEAQVMQKSKYYCDEQCRDQLVSKVEISKDSQNKVCVKYVECCKTKEQQMSNLPTYIRKELPSVSSKEDLPRIVLILESPHKQEFDPADAVEPVKGPAYGVTGDRINEFLLEILSKIPIPFENKGHTITYEVALVNVIQYQCSLGEATSKYRDKMFWKCWKIKEVRDDFCERVRLAIGVRKKECIVINCCTIGRMIRDNHELVNNALEDMGISFYESTHPYGWNWKKNRWIIQHV